MWHIVSGCKKLAQIEYRKRHDKVALRVHWEMCRTYGIDCNDKWYDHQPLPIVENGEVRVTWDMTIYTDKVLKHNRPDITLVHKDTQDWTLIDIAVPADQNIIRTEEEKVEKYQDLAFEIRRIHGASKVTVIPIVIGALGSISKRAKTWYDKLGVPKPRNNFRIVSGHDDRPNSFLLGHVSFLAGQMYMMNYSFRGP